jgi:dihydrofolate reductase
MSRVICGVSMSIDGFIAGLNQSEQKPFGDASEEFLHSWMFDEPEKHTAERDELTSAGAYIMGRNMYGPIGDEYDKSWKGWWGDDPPYHAPVFVLTHRSRNPIPMEGGTTFNFVTTGIHDAMERAQQAAGDRPVSIAGGANIINQYLAARLIDEIWLHIAPGTIGSGSRVFDNVPDLRMEPMSVGGSKLVTHIKYRVLK